MFCLYSTLNCNLIAVETQSEGHRPWYDMAAKLSSFPAYPPIQSPLLKKAPDAVPPTDELEQLCNELKLVKEKALERSKKASDDLKTIEESIRRMTEREKGKFKAIDKIKRERDCTFMLLINDLKNI